MRKTYKVIVTSETFVTIDVDEKLFNKDLLDKVEDKLNEGFAGDVTYFEVEGEVETNE